MINTPNDKSCWLHITSGRGPLQCCWVVTKLAAQIEKEAKGKSIKVKVIDFVPSEKPAICRSILLELCSDSMSNDLLAYAGEWVGTVQWIGKSMYRTNHKRNNWYAGVELLKPPQENNWSTKDVKVETMGAGGPGGQHVNKTESAVRITHLPTGITVTAREERSQRQNKRLAFARLANMLKDKDALKSKEADQKQWQLHNDLERGNPVKVFAGKGFKLRQK